MKAFARLKKEKPLAKKMLLRFAKASLKSIPLIGPVYEMIDENLLESVAEKERDQINVLVNMMYEKLGPLLEQVENISEAELESFLQKPEAQKCLNDFSFEVEKNQTQFQNLTNLLVQRVEQHAQEISRLSKEVEKLYAYVNIGRRFPKLAESIKLKLSIEGNIYKLYDQLNPIKEGSRALFYRAHRIGTPISKVVVIKVLKNELCKDQTIVQRFLLEGFLASQIIHPNIVRITDYGGFFVQNQYYIEMEDLGEDNLIHWCNKNPFVRKNLAAYLNMMIQSVEALTALHRQNIVHRNIQPSSFLLLENKLKLIDFGYIKSLEQGENRPAFTLTAQDEKVGSLAYMSPEQLTGGSISPATDVYSLGITLFQILTQQSFSVSECVKFHTQSPPAPSSFNKEIPPWMDTIILQMLSKEPEERISLASLHHSLKTQQKDSDFYHSATITGDPKVDFSGKTTNQEDTFSGETISHTHLQPLPETRLGLNIARLVVAGSNAPQTLFVYGQDKLQIGRNAIDRKGQDICLRYRPAKGNEELLKKISCQHFQIFTKEEKVFIEDLASRAGTTLDGDILCTKQPKSITDHHQVKVANILDLSVTAIPATYKYEIAGHGAIETNSPSIFIERINNGTEHAYALVPGYISLGIDKNQRLRACQGVNVLFIAGFLWICSADIPSGKCQLLVDGLTFKINKHTVSVHKIQPQDQK